MISLLISILVAGCTGSSNEKTASSPVQESSSTPATMYQDAAWANNVAETTPIMINDTNNVSNAVKNSDWYTTSADLDTYKLDLDTAIKNSDSFTVSPELQACKNEYRLGLIDDYNGAVLMKTGINLLTSGDFKSSTETIDLATDDLRSANRHYDNVTALLKSYNTDHPDAQLDIPLIHHNVDPNVKQQNTVAAPAQNTAPVTKTLADKDPVTEPKGIHASEETVDNVETNENTKSVDSSTHNIFDYCTWQAQITKKIGEYSKAPENKSYVVVTIKINNTGDQTYSTNPGYWHLKIGDMYYQSGSETYDSSLNHMTTDVGPGGKITTKIAYLVDGNPSVSDMGMYYDGPGSDGTIYS